MFKEAVDTSSRARWNEAIAQARASVALLANARHPDEISFGMNAPLSCGSSASPLVKR
jgi:selenocysteine lyase/cysteine desulfurase